MSNRALVVAVLLLSAGPVSVATPVFGPHGPTDGDDRDVSSGASVELHAAGHNGSVERYRLSSELDSADASEVGEKARSTNTTALNLSYTYRRLPGQQGIVGVVLRIPATPGAERVRLEFPEESTVVETESVVQNGSVYEWAGKEPAVVVYRLRVDWSYTGNRRDSWTLLEHLPPAIRSETPVETNETLATAGPGYVGNTTMVLGAHDVYRRQAGGQRIDLVVPGNQSLRYGPRPTVGALVAVSRSLEVGARDERVHAFATPRIRIGASQLQADGFALDGDTILLDTDAELAAWVHEYVHTRQAFSNAESLRWLTEASGRYYEWLLAAESGYAGWGGLRGVFNLAASDESTLAEPETWEAESDYAKGALVLAAIDRDIRAATDGEHTLEDALRRINGNGSSPRLETFIKAVREVGGSDAAMTAKTYVTTGAVPEFQTAPEAFEAVYGTAAPQVERRLLGLSASSENRTRQLDRNRSPIPVGLDESVQVAVRLNNTGAARGFETVVPRLTTDRLAGSYFDRTWVGWVGPGESVTRTATHRFDEPGYHDVVVNGVRYIVRAAPDRDTASVAGLNVTAIDRNDGRITVDVSVRNDGEHTTFAAFPVALDGERVSTSVLVLDGNETRTTTVRLDVPASGFGTIEVGDAGTTVDSVGPSAFTTESTPGPPAANGPDTATTSGRVDDPRIATTGTEESESKVAKPVVLALVVAFGLLTLWGWTRKRQ